MAPRTLLTPEQYGDVVATVLDNNDGMHLTVAARITEQALAFVATAARYPTAVIAPSRVVDEGWHALILHTTVYAELCERLGGFVHHYPERPDEERFDPGVIARTCALMEEAGYAVDRELWTAPGRELVGVAARCQHSPNCGPIEPIPRPKQKPGGPAAA
ncbi:hypothetical protein JJV70_07040 [Streptomyces sp. JJ66]|uniref:glycine-rich domain-containing protein n=1 Tax=Streptomyces sp. JJ66 TaxID=2803843 RepID=UPI001C57EE3D|nr:hypothetical protein [Streptomyces sp. JJ66]MBW1601868.1 hypothetical protein [Streptomyces sp. JJ66]